MLKRNFSLLLSLTLISQHGYSNYKLFPGYYVSLNGDSIRCNIDFRDWSRNPKTIRVQVNNEMHELGAADIRRFGVDGYDDYLSATVSYHIGPVAGNDVPGVFSDSVATEKCFLRILEDARYSLYSLVLPERSYFFTAYADTGIHELIYRVKQKENIIEEDQAYKKEIFSLFAKEGISGQYVNRINRTAYNATDIQPLFRILDGGNAREKNKRKSSGGFQMNVFAGGMMYTFPSSVDGEYEKANHFDPAFSPTGGVDFLYSLGGKFKAIKFGLSLGYSGYSGKLDRSGTNYYFSSVNYNDTVTY